MIFLDLDRSYYPVPMITMIGIKISAYRTILDSRTPITFSETEKEDLAKTFAFADLYIFRSIGRHLQHPIMFANLMRQLLPGKTDEIAITDGKLKQY